MGGFKAVEDRPTPKEVYNWRLYIEASIIATGSLLYDMPRLCPKVSITNVHQIRLRLRFHRNHDRTNWFQERLWNHLGELQQHLE